MNLNNSFMLKLKIFASALGSLSFRNEISLKDKLIQRIFMKIIKEKYIFNFGIFLEINIKYKVIG